MNKVISCLFAGLSLVLGSSLYGYGVDSDYEFHQEKMIVDHGEINIISTFDSQDGISVYNFNGQRLWEVRFHAKIIAWDVQPDIIIVFSKDRDGSCTYLTCLDRITGKCLWEKP